MGVAMKVKRLIEELQGCDPDLEVVMHDINFGDTILYATTWETRGNAWPEGIKVVLECRDDFDVGGELDGMFKYASENDVDELDFFMDMFERGYTLSDIEKHLPDRYEYAKQFCEEHGLV